MLLRLSERVEFRQAPERVHCALYVLFVLQVRAILYEISVFTLQKLPSCNVNIPCTLQLRNRRWGDSNWRARRVKAIHLPRLHLTQAIVVVEAR